MSIKNTVKNNRVLYQIARSGANMINKSWMIFFSKGYGIKNAKAVFISFSGKSYSDNPKTISEMLHERYPEFEIVWLFNDPTEKEKIVPDYVRCVQSNSLQGLKELATARFWVDNFTKSVSTYKSNKQVYIQTWHGDRGFKKILYDAPSNSDGKKIFVEKDICDVMTVGSTSGRNKLGSAFRYSGTFLEYGSPRNDCLIRDSEVEKNQIREKMGISSETKVLLFAPTFRKIEQDKKQTTKGINLSEISRKLKDQTGDDWICLVRAHSASKGLSLTSEDTDNMLDVTLYEDMADLILIADLLITDYSSSVGDFILKKKPILLFQPDREGYLANERTLYFNIDESPFIVADSQEELLEKIGWLDEERAKKNCEAIMAFYDVFETGKATEKVVDYMGSMV